METRVPADDGAWKPPPDEDGSDDIGPRLDALERRLASLESALEKGLAEGVRSAGEEMRRAVSELGRLLLRDLDRLTKVLAEHRDTIVDRLQPGPPDETQASEPPAPSADEASPDGQATRLAGEQGRWTAFPPRRRRRKGL